MPEEHTIRLGRRASLLMAGAAASAPLLPIHAQETRRRVEFGGMKLAAAPPGFKVGRTGEGKPARWVVIADLAAPDKHRFLAEVNRDPVEDRYPHAVLDGVTLVNGIVATRFRPVDGRMDQAGGVVFRYRDVRNYYVARANALEKNVRIYRVVAGVRELFGGAPAPVPRGRWQVLSVRFEGDQFQVSLDSKMLITAKDKAISGAGQAGVWSKSDSLTWFDWLEVDSA